MNTMTIKNITAIIIEVFILILIQIIPVFADDTAEANLYEKVIAHGGGAYKGYETTNSVEALNHSIRSGYKYIELDMDLSADDRIIMLHDWDRTAQHYYGKTFDKKISFSSFQALKVHGQFEVLTFDKLVPILKANQELRIITDTKGNNQKLLETIETKYPEVMEQIIPQIYDYDQWLAVKNLGFDTMIFTLYAMEEIDTEKLASFVAEKNIFAVAMPDYIAEKGYCTALAKRGIRVYVHPVTAYEDAVHYQKLGAWGVYSGSLLPAEFAGDEKDYYLTVLEHGMTRKLTDVSIQGLETFAVHGLRTDDTFAFYIDDSPKVAITPDLQAITEGKHKLTVIISHGKEKNNGLRQADQALPEAQTQLEYLLWKDSKGLRLLHRKFEYRLDSVKNGKDFDAVLSGTTLSEDIRKVMEQSFIAKQGESLFYYKGKANMFMNGDEILSVQQTYGGRLLLPLSTTLKYLGAASVSMDNQKDISVVFGKTRSLVMADTSLIRNGPWITRMNQPVTLYMNKAMAGGEFYQYIAGVTYLEEDGLILLIPGSFQPDKSSRHQMIQTAEQLF